MTPVRAWLLAGAFVSLLQGTGHAVLVLRWKAGHGERESAVIELMRSERFLFQGLSRSYWDFQIGYGLFAAFNCVVQAALLWQLARAARSRVAPITPMMRLLLFANVVYAALSWTFFFITPLAFDSVIALCLGSG